MSTPDNKGRRWTRPDDPKRFLFNVRSSTVVAVMIVLVVCGLMIWMFVASPLAPIRKAPVEEPADVATTNEQPASDFDPKLRLEWPDTPEESRRRINAGQADETTIYSATFTKFGPATSFRATVYEFTEKDLQGYDPKKSLARHLGGGNVVELTRKQIEHGPNKYLGFDVTARDVNLFIRRVNILAGRRIYTVEVVSVKQERLNAEDVGKFIESFVIKE